MGRKQKLREAKRKNKKINSPPTASSNATASSTGAKTADARTAFDNEFPKSDIFKGEKQRSMNGTVTNSESLQLWEQAAIEFACVHSMIFLGHLNSQAPGGRYIPQTHPWYLEAAIRGNCHGMSMLLDNYTKTNLRTVSAVALIEYWKKRLNKMRLIKLGFDTGKDLLLRVCCVCKRRDTETITLQQCMGCSMYCYCNEICQSRHWVEQNHSGECKQLKILNKYHKPYVKEIRNASIRGNIEIPALEKLRYKLGLTRPAEDYEELKVGIHEGKIIDDPYEYVIARKDGTVWVGSNPISPLGQLSSSSADTTTPTNGSLLEENDQQKQPSSSDTTAAESLLEENDQKKE